MNKLLIVGTVAFDAIETPFGKTNKILGGSAPYIGLSAAQFDIQSAIVSIVGGDFPIEYLKSLQEYNIDTSSIDVIVDEKTFFWKGRYLKNMNQRETITTDLNVLTKFKPNVPDSFKDSDVVVLGNLSPMDQKAVISQISNKDALVILDTMNFWMDNNLDELLSVLSDVNVITINEEEARQLTGEYSLIKAAKKIFTMGPENVIIKKGEHGALLFSKGNMFFAPALPLESVFDPTGAGDTFAGGFAGYLTQTKDFSFENMKRAIIYGSAIASFSVEEFGPERLFKLDKHQLESRLKVFKKLTEFEI
jgi:sugar/nucleoside kinase (ribokinase family)|tara:strand:+ start:386 stop:1303 length:918 start_codon:yes stop_codon:yes gene_type:complete